MGLRTEFGVQGTAGRGPKQRLLGVGVALPLQEANRKMVLPAKVGLYPGLHSGL